MGEYKYFYCNFEIIIMKWKMANLLAEGGNTSPLFLKYFLLITMPSYVQALAISMN